MKRRGFLAAIVAAVCPPFTPSWKRSLGYGWCGKCGRTWDKVEHHVTWFRFNASRAPAEGCFVLCQECWCCLQTPEARMPHYRELWAQWGSRPDVKWEEFERAVLAEGAGCGTSGAPVSRVLLGSPRHGRV